jgi:hypothetical protein
LHNIDFVAVGDVQMGEARKSSEPRPWAIGRVTIDWRGEGRKDNSGAMAQMKKYRDGAGTKLSGRCTTQRAWESKQALEADGKDGKRLNYGEARSRHDRALYRL